MKRAKRVTSAQNPLLKSIRRAARSGALTGEGCCLAEGLHLLEEALRSRIPIEAVVASEAAFSRVSAVAGDSPVAAVVVPDEVFSGLAATENSQGVVALVRPPSWALDQILGPASLVLALDGVQDPGNAGSMVRAAEAFGASGVLFLKGSVSPYNPKAVRASAGSLFRIPLTAGVSAEDFLAGVSGRRLTVYVASPSSGEPADAADLVRPCALVIGSEGRGASSVFRRCQAIHIPTFGVESLNAALAAGILLYEARRQRGGQEG